MRSHSGSAVTPIIKLSVLIVSIFTNHVIAETNQEQESEDAIMGAGAHFSWIVFDALKKDLEKATGRKIMLFGKNSMLGVGCNAGIKAAKQNRVGHETFGFVCCPLAKTEIDKHDILLHPLALEPILILVNKKNPVQNLRLEDVRKIFKGEIRNWKEVGGSDKPIVVVTRLHCKDRPGHWKTILPDHKQFFKDRINVKSAAAMVQRVTDFDSAIGHTGSTWKFRKNDRVKAIRIDGIAPTAANLKKEVYPFYRQLSAVTNKVPSLHLKLLIKEAQRGPAFARLAKKYELLPLNNQRK